MKREKIESWSKVRRERCCWQANTYRDHLSRGRSKQFCSSECKFVSAAVKFRVVGLLQTEQPRRPDSRTGHKPLSAECFVWAESAGH
jgi:hypothetical protein